MSMVIVTRPVRLADIVARSVRPLVANVAAGSCGDDDCDVDMVNELGLAGCDGLDVVVNVAGRSCGVEVLNELGLAGSDELDVVVNVAGLADPKVEAAGG